VGFGIGLFNSVGFGSILCYIAYGIAFIGFMGSRIEVIYSMGSGKNIWYKLPLITMCAVFITTCVKLLHQTH
jgi:hypothetical protein